MKKQTDGRYRTKIIVGKKEDGTNITKWISGKTHKELEANRQKILAEYRDGAEPHSKYLLAIDWIKRWYDTCAAPNMKPTVAANKRGCIALYIAPYIKDKAIKAVSAFDLQEIVNNVDKGHTTQQNVASILRGAFKAAWAQGVIPRDVTASLTVRLRPYRSRRALNEDEAKAVEESLSERRTEPLMVALFYYTGMRRGEVLALRWCDIDLKKDIIHVTRSLTFKTRSVDLPKTDAGRRDIPICKELHEILAERQGIGKALLVPGRRGGLIRESAYRTKWKRVQREIFGAEEDCEITPHYFRHNYATRLYDAKVDVLTAARIFGHSDPTTMIKIYTHLDQTARAKKSEKAARRAFEK